MLTPGLILAFGFAVSLVLAVVLHHRREKAELYLPGPRTPERDAGFDEGLERAATHCELIARSSSESVDMITLAAAIRAARRGGAR